MKKRPMLDVVDCSKGFMVPGNVLYVPGAEKTTGLMKAFLKQTSYSYALFKNDTHIEGEYKHSPEAALFPFHQGFGTEEHEYMLSADDVTTDCGVFWLLKNKFDMWAESSDVGVPVEKISFKNAEEEMVYRNLFNIAIKVHGGYSFSIHRDDFIQHISETEGINEVVVIGHATDYCVRDAVIGYIERGFKVHLIEDLCCGIWDATLPGGVSNIQELVDKCPGFDEKGNVVIRTVLKDAVENGDLIITTAAEYIATHVF